MKEWQAKAKVPQPMTRDGLVVENQADGTVENVSSREAEQDYSTDSEGKTVETTRNLKEALQSAQQRPTGEQKQQQEQPDKPKRSRGVRR